MRDWFVKGFDETAWWNLKETIRRGYFIDGCDFFGQIMCGAICFDLVLRHGDDPSEWILWAEAFCLGENTGYGFTVHGIPYCYGDGFMLEFDEHDDYKTTLQSFLKQIDSAVSNDKIWSAYADKTDFLWRDVE